MAFSKNIAMYHSISSLLCVALDREKRFCAPFNQLTSGVQVIKEARGHLRLLSSQDTELACFLSELLSLQPSYHVEKPKPKLYDYSSP